MVYLRIGYAADNGNIYVFSDRKSVDFTGSAGGVICGVQLILLIIPVFLTETALKKNFDKNGKRR